MNCKQVSFGGDLKLLKGSSCSSLSVVLPSLLLSVSEMIQVVGLTLSVMVPLARFSLLSLILCSLELVLVILPFKSELSSSETLSFCCDVVESLPKFAKIFTDIIIIEDRLMLNDDKTEVVLIGTRQQLQKVNLNDITVGDTIVEAKSVVRNLAWFDCNL